MDKYLMIFKKFFFTIVCYATIVFNVQANDFFLACGINNDDLDKVKYIIHNSNSKFIPHQIDEIKNESFKQALYLLSFYKDGKFLSDDMIEVIGFDVIKHIPRFKTHVLNYFFKKKFYNENLSSKENNHFLDKKNEEAKENKKKEENNTTEENEEMKKFFSEIELTIDDYLFILKNKYFVPSHDNENYIKYFLFKVFFKKNLSIEDIGFLRKKYKMYDDEYVLQQIRLRFWNKKIVDLFKLKQLLKDKKILNRVKKLEEFYKVFNEPTISGNNKESNKINKELIKKRKDICSKLIGYDEYIDLSCLKTFKKDMKNIEKILTNNLNASFVPEQWLFYRIYFVREMIDDKKITKNVYDIISNGDVLYEDSDYYKQQFLSGFIAFLLKDYNSAITHFRACIDVSKFSEYKAKAYYWLGLSHRHLNEELESKKAFLEARKNVFTMYGQLAATEINEDPEKNIKEYIISFEEKPEILCNDVNFILGYLDQYKNKSIYLSPILSSYISENTDKKKIFNALIVLKTDFNEKMPADIFSHHSFRFNVINNNINFPIIKYTDDSLVNAIIKKESNFKHGMIGNSGERGVMQIMPATGRVLAKNMNIDFDQKKLLFDNEYNINFGKFYINNLLHKFNENQLLAIASYNAGSKNVEKWISNNGDPRKMSLNEEIAEWIEKIPFSSTRDYITNILGFKIVYDAIKAI